MILDNLFASQKTYLASIQELSQTNTNGILGPKVWTVTKTVSCIFWRGGISERLINQKFSFDVSAVIIMRPSDISVSEIPETSRILLEDSAGNEIGTYSVIYPDNIGEQDQVIMIPVKEIT